MVSRALGIDMAICRAIGLDLMVSLEQPPCVGLMKPEVCQKVAVRDYDGRTKAEKGLHQTVCLVKGHRLSGLLMVECSWVDRLSFSRVLDVVGIWVPTSCTPLHDIQGYALFSPTKVRIRGAPPLSDSLVHLEQGTDAIMDFVYKAVSGPVPPTAEGHVSRKWLSFYYLVPLWGLMVLVLAFYSASTSHEAGTSTVPNVCRASKDYWRVKSHPAWYSGPDFYYSSVESQAGRNHENCEA